jgi:hypothetical protein
MWNFLVIHYSKSTLSKQGFIINIYGASLTVSWELKAGMELWGLKKYFKVDNEVWICLRLELIVYPWNPVQSWRPIWVSHMEEPYSKYYLNNECFASETLSHGHGVNHRPWPCNETAWCSLSSVVLVLNLCNPCPLGMPWWNEIHFQSNRFLKLFFPVLGSKKIISKSFALESTVENSLFFSS